MTSSRLAIASFAAFGLLAATGTARADGAKVNVLVRKRWKAGDVVTRVTKSVSHEQIKVLFQENPVFTRDVRTTTEAERVEKCVEADADGHRTKMLVHFRSWTQSRVNGADGTPMGDDKSLSGVTVEVARATPHPRWTLVDGAAPSKEVSAWLDQAYADDDGREEVLEPGLPVAAGESWKVDPERLAAAFASQLAVDPAKATATVTLEEVVGPRGTLVMKATMPTKFLKNRVMGTEDKWSEGGDATLELRMVGPLDGTPAGSEAHSKFTLKGVAASERGDIHLDVASDGDSTVSAGGTIPEPKAPAPTK